MNRTLSHLLLIVLVGSLVMFPNLGGAPLWDRDEPRNAACAREMMERGDWIVPTFNGELRVLKPALKYWLMMLAYQLFGVNEFAARFPSAFFGIATALAVYFIGKRLFSARAGLWAALILLSNILFVATGHLAKIDPTLTFFSTLPILIFVYATFRRVTEDGQPSEETTSRFSGGFPTSWLVAVGLYAAVGMAALAKGLLGLLFPPAVLGMFLLIVRLPKQEAGANRLLGVLRPFGPLHFLKTLWTMRPITGFWVSLAVAVPWYVLVGIQTNGEFPRAFFLEHHFGRAMEPLEGHGGPFLLYYATVICIGFFPWSILMIPVGMWLVGKWRENVNIRPAFLLPLCWLGVYLVLLSIPRTKLPNYISPCFPALALLAGPFLAEWSAGLAVPRRWLQGSFAWLGGIGVAFSAGIVILARIMFPGEEWLGAFGIVLIAGGILGFRYLGRGQMRAASLTLAATSIVFCALVFAFGVPRIGHYSQQAELLARISQRDASAEIGYLETIEPTWVFYAGRLQPLHMPDKIVAPAERWHVQSERVDRFFAEGPQRYLLVTDQAWNKLRSELPADAQVIDEAPRFLQKGRWLLIGRASEGETLAQRK